jgi:hypothetical protein
LYAGNAGLFFNHYAPAAFEAWLHLCLYLPDEWQNDAEVRECYPVLLCPVADGGHINYSYNAESLFF